MTPPDPKPPAGEALSDARALVDRLTHNIETQRVLVDQTAAGSVEREAARLAYAVMKDARSALLTPPATDAAASGAGADLPTDRYGMTVLDRMRDTAENGTMPPEERKDLFALLDLAAAPKVASDAGAGLRSMLQEAHDTLHECTAVLHADDCRKVAAVMERIRKALATDATDGATVASDAAGLREALASLVDKASDPNGWDWMFPLRVVAVDGKPTIVSHKGGNLFRGYIGTWDEAALLVALANAAPVLLAALAATPGESATRADHAQGGGEPFAYFQRNEGWGIWEEVGPDHKGDDPSIVAAYRHPPTTPGADLLEQADIVDVVLPIIVRNTPSVGRSAHHVACEVADAVLRALSPARDGAVS